MSETQTTKPATKTTRKPRAVRKPAAQDVPQNPTGRTTVGDNGGGHHLANAGKKAETAKPAAAAKTKKAAMGESGYRVKFGTSDAEICKAVQAHIEAEQWPSMSDQQIVSVIGWAVTAKTAIAKVRAHLTARQQAAEAERQEAEQKSA